MARVNDMHASPATVPGGGVGSWGGGRQDYWPADVPSSTGGGLAHVRTVPRRTRAVCWGPASEPGRGWLLKGRAWLLESPQLNSGQPACSRWPSYRRGAEGGRNVGFGLQAAMQGHHQGVGSGGGSASAALGGCGAFPAIADRQQARTSNSSCPAPSSLTSRPALAATHPPQPWPTAPPAVSRLPVSTASCRRGRWRSRRRCSVPAAPPVPPPLP